jgi:formylglycine-generating enzyme required for sulfatase activity/serine/threonine protein kinase
METQVLEGINGGQTQIITGEERGMTASSGAMLQPGEIVSGYTVKERLPASGGEAEVYVCTKAGEPYALKYYYTRKTETEVIDKIKKITHPGIVSIMDSGEYKGRFFTVLEYAAGGALDDKQPDGSFKYLPVSEDQAAGIVRETIEAFEACHPGIIHRDIKPGNLLYKNAPAQGREAGGILISDFGIASIVEAEDGMSKHLTETGARTEGYAAPEVYSGVIGKELDYYALGVTLWVLLTGEEPFVDEEGRVLNINQIMLDTIQGKTADSLLSRSPQIRANMKKLIRGLLSVRHDKRWGYDEVKRHLNGEDVEVFHEERTLPVVEIGGESCASYKEIAEALLKHPEEGKKFVFQEKLSNYLIKIDQKRSDQIDEVIDRYSAEKREDEGTVFAAYSLCPNLPFEVDHGRSISGFIDILKILEDDPQALLPYLKERERGFYAYLEVMNLAEEGKRVKEIVESTSGGIRAAARIIAAFQGNRIAPFQDGVNGGYELSSIDDLAFLPDYLKERTLILVERNCGLLPAWIENLNGRNLDGWLSLLAEWREHVEEHGAWDYFNLFLQGKDIAVLVDYLVKNRDITAIKKAIPWFLEEKQYAVANKLIDRVWPEYYKERNWAAVREILTYIDETRQEGLDRPYDFYLAHIGLCLYRENQIDNALGYVNKALSMNTTGFDLDNVPYAYAAGCIFMRKGNVSGAAAAFNDAVSLKPDLPQAILRRGACLLSLKNYTEAAACCSQLLEGQFSGPAFESTAQARAYKIRALSYAEMEDMQARASDDEAQADIGTKAGAVDIFDDYLSSIDAIIAAFEAEKNARVAETEERKRREAEKIREEERKATAKFNRKKIVFSILFWCVLGALVTGVWLLAFTPAFLLASGRGFLSNSTEKHFMGGLLGIVLGFGIGINSAFDSTGKKNGYTIGRIIGKIIGLIISLGISVGLGGILGWFLFGINRGFLVFGLIALSLVLIGLYGSAMTKRVVREKWASVILMPAALGILIFGTIFLDPGILNALAPFSSDNFSSDNFILVESGTFDMGSSSGEEDEKPVHSVMLTKAFYISKWEVTQAEYEELMRSNPSLFKGNYHPVENVTWYDAVEYCNARSEKEGLTPVYTIDKDNSDPNNRNNEDNIKWTVTWDKKANGYRLPTEAEWEYACRAGVTEEYNVLGRYAGTYIRDRLRHKPKKIYYFDRKRTRKVSAGGSNQLGLYNITGNVWEWCWDWEGPYSDNAQIDPSGPSSGEYRELRGGGINNSTVDSVRSANRGHTNSADRDSSIGFRIVRNAEGIQNAETIATIISGQANIRSAPDSTKNNVIIQMKRGDTLIVTGSVNKGWLPVEVNGQAGYISADLVEISGAQ